VTTAVAYVYVYLCVRVCQRQQSEKEDRKDMERWVAARWSVSGKSQKRDRRHDTSAPPHHWVLSSQQSSVVPDENRRSDYEPPVHGPRRRHTLGGHAGRDAGTAWVVSIVLFRADTLDGRKGNYCTGHRPRMRIRVRHSDTDRPPKTCLDDDETVNAKLTLALTHYPILILWRTFEMADRHQHDCYV